MDDNSSGPKKQVTVHEALAFAIEKHQSGMLGLADEIYSHVLDVFPDHPDALHFRGVLLHQQGKSDEAIVAMRRAAELVPDHADFQINLGNVFLSLGRGDEALACYEGGLALRPTSADAHCNRGVALRAMHRDEEAEESYRAAILNAPEHVAAYHNLANLLSDMSKHKEACQAYEKALSLREDLNESHRALAVTLWRLGNYEQAIKNLRVWLRVSPENPIAQHLLAAFESKEIPQRAADAYIRETFDDFASSFEIALERLHYQAPSLVADIVQQNAEPPNRSLTVLDGGCGTGLSAPALREYAHKLIGVDLSPGMLRAAKQTGLYDDLVEAELTAYLDEHQQHFDLITIVDTLCYFGELGEVFRGCTAAIRPQGLLAFTVEKSLPEEAPNGVVLRFHGRYAHTPDYVKEQLAGAGLQLVQCVEATLRRECGQPVEGLVIAARPALTNG